MKEIFDSSDKLYIVLELVTGGELFDRIVSKGSYSEKEASELMKQVLDALSYLHAKGIVHRDLKPENLLYASPAPDAPIKLADFGLAKIVSSGGQSSVMHTTCGTPGYVAPEVLKNDGYDTQVDAWSMGVILYILLCGFPPFHDDNQALLFEQIKNGKYDFPDPWWSNISDQAKDLVKKMMTVDPKARYSIDDCLKHPWISGDAASDAPIQGLAESMRKWNARRKFRQGALGVIASNKMKKLMEGLTTAAKEIEKE